MTAVPLVGRDHEMDVIGRLLEGVRDAGAALVVRGDAGVGKSALLATAAGMAAERGMLVLNTAGVQAEMNLPFAALHHLLQPVMVRAEDLPALQRDAIRAAFAMTDSAFPDLFLIALAALELLSEVAGDSPLLLIADDAQWLDRPSADVLAFVARRLHWDPIIVLASVREGHDSPLASASLPELRLGGLGDGPARELLDAHFPGLAPAVVDRLLAEAGGNPLALLELPVTLSSSALGGEALLPPHLPLTERLEQAFAARVAGLPAITRALLQVASAGDGGLLGEIIEAAGIVAGARPAVADLDLAARDGLIRVDGSVVRFCHPLVRSAVYQAATVAERHAAHAALAEVLADEPERRVWHRAAAAVGWDAAVAAELEEVAGCARRRGDLVTAVAGYERAASLTRAVGRRGVLLLRAAEVATELGRREMVRRLLREADSLELGPRERARSLWLGDLLRSSSARDPAQVQALVETARAMTAEGDTDLALSLLSVAADRCYWGVIDGQPVAEVLAAADQVGVAPGDPRLLYIQAYAAPLTRGAVILGHLARLDPPSDPDTLRLLAVAATATGAWDQAFCLSGTAAARLREQGRLDLLAQILAIQSWTAIMIGADYPAALTLAEEAARLAAETTQPPWEILAWTAQAAVAALRGHHTAAEHLAARVESTAPPHGATSNLGLLQYVRGLSALGRGRYEEAYDHLRRTYDPVDPARSGLASYMVGELAEAAAHSGNRDEAHAIIGDIESLAEQTPSQWLHATLRYSRAVLADDEDAGEHFREATNDQEIARWPFLRARLQLAFGQWLRRQRRISESRRPLRAARDTFDALGATPWGERARQQLRAAGETSQRREPATIDALTPQELQIVQMAADGLSNREISQKLYLSHRTVESHLYRAFPKLGITSRAQLLSVLGNRLEALDYAR